MTTLKEISKQTGTPVSELATKAGELGFKNGTTAPLPKNIEEQLAKLEPVKSNNNNGNGKSNLTPSSNDKTIDLDNPNLEEKIKVAIAIGITEAEILLEAERQAFEQRIEQGQEEMADYILDLYKEHKEALNELEAQRPARDRQSISEKFAKLQAQLVKK